MLHSYFNWLIQPNLLYQCHAHSHAHQWVPPPLLFSSQQWNLGAMLPFLGKYYPALSQCPFFPLKGLLQISSLINSFGQGFITSCLDNDKNFTPPLFVHAFFQSIPVTQLLIMPPSCLWHWTSWALMLLYVQTHFLLLTMWNVSPDLIFHYLLSHPCSFLPPKTLHPSSFYSWTATSKVSPTLLHSSSGEKFSFSVFIEIQIFRTRIFLGERPSTLLNFLKNVSPEAVFLFKTQLKRYFLHVTDSDSSKNLMFSNALSNVCSVCSAGRQLPECGNHMFLLLVPHSTQHWALHTEFAQQIVINGWISEADNYIN